MKIHITIPFALDKDLGKAYNEACSLVPEGDWICILDHDVMFLTPDAINIMYEYAEACQFPALLTCRANRVHPINKGQLFGSEISENENILHHIKIATNLSSKRPYTVSQLTGCLSGFLMLFPKVLWEQVRFIEGKGCLGVDTKFFHHLYANNVLMYVMDNLYIWHTYRLQNGINSKDHLK